MADSNALVRTMATQLIGLVRAKIISGAYAPGTALPQDAIAAEFGVSKIPVREALLQLHAEGLVDVFAHRGFQVRPMSAREVEEIFRLRAQIEPQAIAAGARLAEPADREAAQEAFGRLHEALSAGRLEGSGDLNRIFHLALVVPGRQPLTHEVLQRLLTLSQRYVRLHLEPYGRSSRADREHEVLLAAWSAGKDERVEELARSHIQATYEDLARAGLEFRAQGPT